MTVSFVIPNYNGEEILKRNFPKVLAIAEEYASKENIVEIVFVDDASQDASVSLLQSFVRESRQGEIRVKLLINNRNYGFSSTVNKGVKEAKGEIIMLLNTDAYPEPKKDFLKKIVAYFSDENLFAVGCMDKSIESDGRVILRGRGIGMWREGFLVHRRGEVDKTNTLWASGGSSAFRKSLWEKLGGLYVLYNPFYWEDIDLSYRALKAGHEVRFAPECVVVHEHEHGSIKSNRSPFKVRATATRNQFFFAWINLTDSTLLIEHIIWIPLHVFKALVRLDRVFLFGFISALLRMGDTFFYRRRVIPMFRKKDAEVVASFVDEM